MKTKTKMIHRFIYLLLIIVPTIIVIIGITQTKSVVAFAFAPSSIITFATNSRNRRGISIDRMLLDSPNKSVKKSFLMMSSSSSGTMTDATTSLTIYGHPGTRSPLINWACYELKVPFTMADNLNANPHPFKQLPCLVDDDDVVIFESGAILQYLQTQKSGNVATITKAQLGAILSWITWANASLDPVCFKETPDGKVYDTGLRDMKNKKLIQLNTILKDNNYMLVPNAGFTLADVAVSSYLLYTILFFPDVMNASLMKSYPNIVQYMKNCVERPTYRKAFGEQHYQTLTQRLK